MHDAERGLRRHRRLSNALVIVVSLLALVGVVSHPTTSRVWLVVAAMIGLTNFELLSSVRSSLHAAVEVSGGGERLEALATTAQLGTIAWPEDAHAPSRAPHDRRGRACAGARRHARASSRALTSRLWASRASGKSTLLRALSRLDHASSGSITIGGVDLAAINEDEFRRHVTYVASEPGLTRGYAIDVVLLGRSTERDPFSDLGALGLDGGPHHPF